MLLGDDDEAEGEVVVLASPIGEGGPRVALLIKKKWQIGSLGRLGGKYSNVARVEQLIAENAELPAACQTRGVAATPLELRHSKIGYRN